MFSKTTALTCVVFFSHAVTVNAAYDFNAPPVYGSSNYSSDKRSEKQRAEMLKKELSGLKIYQSDCCNIRYDKDHFVIKK